MNSPDERNEVELLNDILGELKDLNAQLARVDERSRINRDSVETMRENRIEPLEEQANRNDVRGRRNSLILGAGISILTIVLAAAINMTFNLITLWISI